MILWEFTKYYNKPQLSQLFREKSNGKHSSDGENNVSFKIPDVIKLLFVIVNIKSPTKSATRRTSEACSTCLWCGAVVLIPQPQKPAQAPLPKRFSVTQFESAFLACNLFYKDLF
jgi:hypothetical protein